ncbi:hypothetical protein SSX86_024694 [Deinandra increscens subsp. villosa]|uniref:Uncharacterized protein n=1 Tax=Deinandra increscens subsp. villosa TaxID=3103831 RepID=A0AAP0CC05_9ASTR
MAETLMPLRLGKHGDTEDVGKAGGVKRKALPAAVSITPLKAVWYTGPLRDQSQQNDVSPEMVFLPKQTTKKELNDLHEIYSIIAMGFPAGDMSSDLFVYFEILETPAPVKKKVSKSSLKRDALLAGLDKEKKLKVSEYSINTVNSVDCNKIVKFLIWDMLLLQCLLLMVIQPQAKKIEIPNGKVGVIIGSTDVIAKAEQLIKDVLAEAVVAEKYGPYGYNAIEDGGFALNVTRTWYAHKLKIAIDIVVTDFCIGSNYDLQELY